MNVDRVRAIVRRHWWVLWRSPHRWFDIAFWPVLDVVMFGSLGTYVARQDTTSGATAPFLLAGILMFHVVFQVQISASTGFMEETWSRNLLNMMTTPLRETEWAGALAFFGLLKLVLAVGTASITAFVLFGFNLGSAGWGLVPVMAVLMTCGWALALVVIGLILRFGQSAEIFAWGLNFVILAMSGVFNPIEALPGGLQPISKALPTTYAFRAVRALLAGEPLPTGDLVIAAVGAVVAAVLGLAFITRMLTVFRQRGLVTRYS